MNDKAVLNGKQFNAIKTLYIMFLRQFREILAFINTFRGSDEQDLIKSIALIEATKAQKSKLDFVLLRHHHPAKELGDCQKGSRQMHDQRHPELFE